MATPYVGEIMIFAGNFAPKNWAFCNGQLISVSQNNALFALLGTTYGGNGVSTFALPDLRSRVPVHFGQGTGLSNYALGQIGGTENIGLTITNLPSHTHGFSPSGVTASVQASGAYGDTSSPTGNYLSNGGDTGGGVTTNAYSTPGNAGTPANIAGVSFNLSSGAIGLTGNNIPFPILQPYLALNFVISLYGNFPSRN